MLGIFDVNVPLVKVGTYMAGERGCRELQGSSCCPVKSKLKWPAFITPAFYTTFIILSISLKPAPYDYQGQSCCCSC